MRRMEERISSIEGSWLVLVCSAILLVPVRRRSGGRRRDDSRPVYR
jgi:hypothetical protein